MDLRAERERSRKFNEVGLILNFKIRFLETALCEN